MFHDFMGMPIIVSNNAVQMKNEEIYNVRKAWQPFFSGHSDKFPAEVLGIRVEGKTHIIPAMFIVGGNVIVHPTLMEKLKQQIQT